MTKQPFFFRYTLSRPMPLREPLWGPTQAPAGADSSRRDWKRPRRCPIERPAKRPASPLGAYEQPPYPSAQHQSDQTNAEAEQEGQRLSKDQPDDETLGGKIGDQYTRQQARTARSTGRPPSCGAAGATGDTGDTRNVSGTDSTHDDTHLSISSRQHVLGTIPESPYLPGTPGTPSMPNTPRMLSVLSAEERPSIALEGLEGLERLEPCHCCLHGTTPRT